MKVVFNQSDTKDLTCITIVSPTSLKNRELCGILVDLAKQFEGISDESRDTTEQGGAASLEAARDHIETGD